MGKGLLSEAARLFLIAFGDGCIAFYWSPNDDTEFTVARLNLCVDDDYYSVGRNAGLSEIETEEAIRDLVEGDFVTIARDVPAIQSATKGSDWYARYMSLKGDKVKRD